MIKIFTLRVQIDRKPYTYEKDRLIGEVTEDEAKVLHERCMKHIHISKNGDVVWLSYKDEAKFNIKPMIYCLFEGFTV